METTDNHTMNALAARRPLFWDIDEKDIPTTLMESDEWVLVRVLQYGTLKDIDLVIAFYGEERSRKVLLTVDDMPDVAYALAFLYLKIDRKGKYVV